MDRGDDDHHVEVDARASVSRRHRAEDEHVQRHQEQVDAEHVDALGVLGREQHRDELVGEAEQEHEARQHDQRQLAHAFAQQPDHLVVVARADQRRHRGAQHGGHRGLEDRVERDLQRADRVDRVVGRREARRDDAAVEIAAEQAHQRHQPQRHRILELLAREPRLARGLAQSAVRPDQPDGAHDEAQHRVAEQGHHEAHQAEAHHQRQHQDQHADDGLGHLHQHRDLVAVARDHELHEVLGGDQQPQRHHVPGHRRRNRRVAHRLDDERARDEQADGGQRAAGRQDRRRLQGEHLVARRVLAVVEVVDGVGQAQHQDRDAQRADQRELLVGAVVGAIEHAHQDHRRDEANRVLDEVGADQETGLV